ncbi:hypothetical protein JW948_04110 [bacterium]|nr:hypothetical protein [bacterium]
MEKEKPVLGIVRDSSCNKVHIHVNRTGLEMLFSALNGLKKKLDSNQNDKVRFSLASLHESRLTESMLKEEWDSGFKQIQDLEIHAWNAESVRRYKLIYEDPRGGFV